MSLCLMGCTTLRSIEGTPRDLQQRIATGVFLKPGDRVVIHTSDGATHDLVIDSIRDSIINADREAIPLETVVLIQKRESIDGKTVGLAIGIVLGAALNVLIVWEFSHLGSR